MKTSSHSSTSSITISRIETFSDGIFAIIMTLLVLELKAPQIMEGAPLLAHFQALMPLIPKFLSFAMSFLVIAIFWVNHHSFFNSIEKADSKILWFNNHLLFWLCFIPFPTAWVGDNIRDPVAVALYGLTLFIGVAAFQLLVAHAYKTGLFKAHIDEMDQKRRSRRVLPGLILYALSIPLAFISIYLALVIFAAVLIFYFIPD